MRAEEGGYVEAHTATDDPLFRGLPSTFPLSESHGWVLRDIPKGYELLGSTVNCYVQIMRQPGRVWYGIQGHPERGWTGPFPHGRILLGNLFSMVEREQARR